MIFGFIDVDSMCIQYTTPEAATAALPAVEETVQAGRRTSLAAHSTSRELDDTGSGLAMEDPLYEAPESQMHSVHNPREGLQIRTGLQWVF